MDDQSLHQAVSGGDLARGMALLTDAAGKGDAEAAVRLAVLFLEGRTIGRNLSQARRWFGRAGELGHPRAKHIHIALMANGVGGPRLWSGAVNHLKQLAVDDHSARRQFDLIAGMALDEEGNPTDQPPIEPVPGTHSVRWSRALLTNDECSLLIECGAPYLAPSVIVDPRTGAARPDPIRTSRAAIFPWVDENPFIHAINRRLAAATCTRVEQGEPLQLLEYGPGQEYRPHSDALSGADNQRIITALVYLNDDYEGGETSFPRLGLDLRGSPGDALIFDNVDENGRADPAMIHAGRPVTKGLKYLASRWIREADFGTR